MLAKYVFLPLAFVIICFNLSFAEGLMAAQAKEYYQDGVKAQKGGNFETADTFYQKALIVDPNNPEWQKAVLNNRGIMSAMAGDTEAAEQLFSRALKIDSNYKVAQFNLGLIYEKRRTRLESLEYWVKIFELDKMIPKNYIVEDGQAK